MKMNRNQEEAVRIAIRAMESVLEKDSIDINEKEQFDFAIKELGTMRDKSIATKLKEKAKKMHWDNLLKNSDIVTLDAKWYDENIRKETEE